MEHVLYSSLIPAPPCDDGFSLSFQIYNVCLGETSVSEQKLRMCHHFARSRTGISDICHLVPVSPDKKGMQQLIYELIMQHKMHFCDCTHLYEM